MNCYPSTNSLVDAIGTRSCYIKNRATKLDQTELTCTTFRKFSTLTRFFLDLFMFRRRYSNCRPQTSARYNRIICQAVVNMSFLERLSCILHAFEKGYQGHKSNFGFHVPFDREIRQILDQKSVFGFAERNTVNTP